jgi:hypothetical protein
MPEEARVSLRVVLLPEQVFVGQIPPDIDRMHLVPQGANQVQLEACFVQASRHRPAGTGPGTDIRGVVLRQVGDVDHETPPNAHRMRLTKSISWSRIQ